jgi:hypothetical protein
LPVTSSPRRKYKPRSSPRVRNQPAEMCPAKDGIATETQSFCKASPRIFVGFAQQPAFAQKVVCFGANGPAVSARSAVSSAGNSEKTSKYRIVAARKELASQFAL